jgi:hypothetical protein
MARRSTPERINEARHAALRNLLVDEQRLTLDDAEAWVRAWEAEAARLGIAPSTEYWTVGGAWIDEQRQGRRRSA